MPVQHIVVPWGGGDQLALTYYQWSPGGGGGGGGSVSIDILSVVPWGGGQLALIYYQWSVLSGFAVPIPRNPACPSLWLYVTQSEP